MGKSQIVVFAAVSLGIVLCGVVNYIQLLPVELYPEGITPQTSTPLTTTVGSSSPSVNVCSNEVRRKNMKQFCRFKNASTEVPNKTIIFVIDQYKLIYCDIPKTGSTSFKLLLGNLVMPPNQTVDRQFYLKSTGFRKFDEIDPEEQKEILRKYYKMVVIRHPLDRLRSSLGDRIQAEGNGQEKMREMYSPAIKSYLLEKGLTTEETFDPHKDILNLEQFFDLIAQNRSDFQNVHWQTYWNLCNPCVFDYDLIIKLETVETDVDRLYSYLRSVNRSISLPELEHRRNRVGGVTDKLSLLTDMVKDFDPAVMEKIVKFLQKDFAFGGYSYNRKEGAICRTGEFDCC